MRMYGLLSVFLLIITSGCFNFREYVVEADYSYHGKFKKYKTFNFLNFTNQDSDTTIRNSVIENAIKSRLELQGYQLVNDNPNIIVSYKLFYDNFRFQGYEQPDIEEWAKRGTENEEYNPVKYDLKEGTLLVLLWDNTREKAVWQGYASGLFGNPYANDERNLRRAVRSIFDKYRFFAEGFMVNNEEL